MAVKDREKAIEALERSWALFIEAGAAAAEIREALEAVDERDVVRALIAARVGEREEPLIAFAETVREVLGDRPLSVQAARRAGLIAAAGEVWEGELGPLLSSAQVRELLGDVSRQRVDELLRNRRLIGLRDRNGRRRFPVFQFRDDRPLQPLVGAFWTLVDAPVDDWTAASWCVTEDDALDGRSPAAWARDGLDADRLARVARQDAARLAR